MPILADLPKPRGLGRRKIAAATASITGTGAVTPGLATVEYAVSDLLNAGTVLPTNSVAISSIAAGAVNVVVTRHAAAANTVEVSAFNVTVIAIGY